MGKLALFMLSLILSIGFVSGGLEILGSGATEGVIELNNGGECKLCSNVNLTINNQTYLDDRYVVKPVVGLQTVNNNVTLPPGYSIQLDKITAWDNHGTRINLEGDELWFWEGIGNAINRPDLVLDGNFAAFGYSVTPYANNNENRSIDVGFVNTTASIHLMWRDANFWRDGYFGRQVNASRFFESGRRVCLNNLSNCNETLIKFAYNMSDGAGNSSWNQSFANTLYRTIDPTTGVTDDINGLEEGSGLTVSDYIIALSSPGYAQKFPLLEAVITVTNYLSTTTFGQPAQRIDVVQKNTSYQMTDFDGLIEGNATAGSISISVGGSVGRQVTVIKVDNSINTVTVNGSILGGSSTLATQGQAVTVRRGSSTLWYRTSSI